MAGDIGFEPMNDGVKVRCLTAWRIPKVFGAGEENRTLTTSLEGWGSTIELHPRSKVVEGEAFEPSKSLITDLQSAPFGHSGTPPLKSENWSR